MFWRDDYLVGNTVVFKKWGSFVQFAPPKAAAVRKSAEFESRLIVTALVQVILVGFLRKLYVIVVICDVVELVLGWIIRRN